ncbi:SCO family protein [Pleionea litopenaei]|uniref:SCO family protein n=1 Tax=Pleionea litopenaei TaxID=3070815 RepID=A0AA51RRM3_9GAMM|nr:SCO family protein [Pleionea sp. HL-JVS1]WMS86326.1 SCO family protein [Pleionea sp. HL-JVS1]
MKYLQQIILYTAITVIVILAGVYFLKAEGTKEQELQVTMVYPKLKTVAPFVLGEGEKTFTQEYFKDHWTLVFFGYTYCPDICPTTMSALKNFYQKLPQEIQEKTQVLLVSVDPERDNAEQLANYANAFHADFDATTGSHEALHKFSRDFGAIYAKSGEGDDYLVDHTGKVFLIDPLSRRYAFINKSMDDPSMGYEYNIEAMLSDYLAILEQN